MCDDITDYDTDELLTELHDRLTAATNDPDPDRRERALLLRACLESLTVDWTGNRSVYSLDRGEAGYTDLLALRQRYGGLDGIRSGVHL